MNNKILWLAMLCVASGSCVELENICSSDTFEYKGVLVNAFHRVQWDVTFESLGHYLIHDNVKCVISEFKNKTNFWEALRIKRAYNREFAKFYAENLANATAEEFEKKSFSIGRDTWKPLLDMKKEEQMAQCVESFEQTVFSGFGVLSVFEKLFLDNVYPTDSYADYMPTNSEAVEALEKLMNQFSTSTDGQTFAFGSDDALDVYFYRTIVLPKEFKFLKADSGRVSRETKSLLAYDQLFPFNNPNHKDENCVAAKDLPLLQEKRKGISMVVRHNL